MSTYESYAEYYHDLTKYTPEGIANNQHRIDFNSQPEPFKDYPLNKHIDLSYVLPLDRNPFSDLGIKNPKDFTNEEKYLSRISKLLYLTNGITASVPNPSRPFYLRSAPSAGGLYPTEIYLCSFDNLAIENGIYNYQVLSQSLAQIKKGNYKEEFLNAVFKNPFIENCKQLLILTGVFFRSSWRYQDRAYRRICLDTGHVIGNINVVSNYCGFKAINIGGFLDKEINELLGLNEEEEQALSIIALYENNENPDFNFPFALPSKLDNINIKTPEGNRLLELHNRSRIDSYIKVPEIKNDEVESKFVLSPKVTLGENIDLNLKTQLLELILKRRSTRSFSGQSISKEKLQTILDFAYHPEIFKSENLDPHPNFFDASLIKTFIAINGVNGIEEGCYFYSPQGGYLRQVRFKNFREDIYYLCLGQELGYKASAVIFHTCNLSNVVYKYGERAYRYLHLDAGHIGQRINLSAIQLGVGVSGIGGFFDDQVNDLLGIPENEAVIYITALGVPENKEEVK